MAWHRIRGDRCVYCGQTANSDEHWPPQAYVTIGVILPACRECNSFAHTAHATNWDRRVAYVKEKVRKRWVRDLKVADWTERELKELGPKMRKEVQASLDRKVAVQERLCWEPARYLGLIAGYHLDASELAANGIKISIDGMHAKTKERP